MNTYKCESPGSQFFKPLNLTYLLNLFCIRLQLMIIFIMDPSTDYFLR